MLGALRAARKKSFLSRTAAHDEDDVDALTYDREHTGIQELGNPHECIDDIYVRVECLYVGRVSVDARAH